LGESWFIPFIDEFRQLIKVKTQVTDLKNIEYDTDKDNNTLLADKDLENKFRAYHMEKTNLRIRQNGLYSTHFLNQLALIMLIVLYIC
jgi:hypothetical protein